jgi:AcrR family transcriptional regulator
MAATKSPVDSDNASCQRAELDNMDCQKSSMTAAPLPTRAYRGVSAEARRAARRERLIEAGLERFGTLGYHRTTVRDLCAEARLTERYFYESFDGREELIVAVFAKVAGEVAERIVAAVAAALRDPRALARAAIRAAIVYVTDDPRRARILLLEAAGSVPELERRRREIVSDYARIVQRTQRDLLGPGAPTATDARLTSLAIVASLAELILEWQVGGLEVSRERLIEHCTALMHAVGRVSSEPRAHGPASHAPRRADRKEKRR